MNFDFLISLLFPRRCLACGISLCAGALCTPCRSAIPIFQTLFCGACSTPLSAATLRGAARSFCHPAFPHLLGAAGNYENPALNALIRALKFRGVRSAAEPLANILVTYMLPFAANFKNYLVVPIPLSRKRLRLRGFNQSELLAKRFAERLDLPLETGCLVRAKHAKPQSETKSVAERRKNIHGCFAAATTETFRGKNIILIDDVSTSGATFLEAAQALKSAGAANLCALAAAKA